MITIRPNCEHCGKDLPFNATDAMICSFECTFCRHCVEAMLKNVCPNCGGGFTVRPVRPQHHLLRHPASGERVQKPIDWEVHKKLLAQYGSISPECR